MSKIDSNKFKRYEKVKKSGVTNMFDWLKVTQLARLTKGEVTEIQKNYREYQSKFLDFSKS
jgi:hypothetical protein